MKQMTVAQARRILAPVPYNQRLKAGRMSMPSGIYRELLGSIDEVHCFLTPCSKSLPAVDFQKLADWIETSLQDGKTAEQIRKVYSAKGSYVDNCKATYELLGTRIEEAKQAIKHSVIKKGGPNGL